MLVIIDGDDDYDDNDDNHDRDVGWWDGLLIAMNGNFDDRQLVNVSVFIYKIYRYTIVWLFCGDIKWDW